MTTTDEECLWCLKKLDNNAPRPFCDDTCEQQWHKEQEADEKEKRG